jgi:hypothetical protein
MFDIANNLYNVFLTSGKEATVGLGTKIGEILNDPKMSPENAQIFADALNSIDWTNMDDVEGLSELLNDMGFEGEIADIEEFEDQIKEAAKALKQINFDTLKEEIKSTQELVKDIEERENHERTFTQEERDLMVAANESLASDFVMTGIDEFVYVGDSMGSLIEALNSNTAALLGKYGEQVTHDAEMSRKWQEIAESDRHWFLDDGTTDYGTDY